MGYVCNLLDNDCKLASLILLSLTELFIGIITIHNVNDTSLPGRHDRRMLKPENLCFQCLLPHLHVLLGYMLCLVLLWAKNFSGLLFEVLDGGSSLGCKRLEG